MAEKRRYTVSLPDHVSDELEKRASALGATSTEYAGSILRWWYGQGCPPVSPDEEHLRRGLNINVFDLNTKRAYLLSEDQVVQGLMAQLNLPNLFARVSEYDEIHQFAAFEDHPTHWIVIHLWKGLPRAADNGLFFEAIPKKTTSRSDMLARLKAEAKRIGHDGPVNFSQLPTKLDIPEIKSAVGKAANSGAKA